MQRNESTLQISASRHWLLLGFGTTGVAVSMAGIAGFVLGILQNTLPWSPEGGIREHYVAVGDSFSQGFLAGFFLCFFLSLIAIAVASMVEARRRMRVEERRPRRVA